MWKQLITIISLSLLLPLTSYADNKMDIRVQRGISEYEVGNYAGAIDHWSSALVRGTQLNESVMYPASYLCAMWYHGKGVEKSLDRAVEACSLVQGKRGRFEMDIFLNVLKGNGANSSALDFKQAIADAATSLDWYMKNYMPK